MRIALEDLRSVLTKEGTTEIFKQGKQSFKRERPEFRNYTTLIPKYSTVMKQLIDILPPEIGKPESDALLDFIKKGQIKK